MRNLSVWILCAFVATGVAEAKAEQIEAVVVFNKSGCRSRYVAESNLGYIYLEWYGGSDPSEGETIVGDLHSFGFKDIYNLNTRRSGRVWVDDYMLSRSRVQQKLAEHCS